MCGSKCWSVRARGLPCWGPTPSPSCPPPDHPRRTPPPIQDTIASGSKEGGKIWEATSQRGPQALLSLPKARQPCCFYHLHTCCPRGFYHSTEKSCVPMNPTSCPVPDRECGAHSRDQERVEKKQQRRTEEQGAPGLLAPRPWSTPPAHRPSARAAQGRGRSWLPATCQSETCGLGLPPPIPPPSPTSPCVFHQLSTRESCTYYWFWVVGSVFFFFLIK